jgi:hypothetical protein
MEKDGGSSHRLTMALRRIALSAQHSHSLMSGKGGQPGQSRSGSRR